MLRFTPGKNLKLTSVKWPRARFVFALALTAALVSGVAIDRSLLLSGIPSDSVEDFQLMAQAWDVIDHYYVDPAAVRHAGMAYSAISGMTESLGDSNHSVYLSRGQAKRAGTAMQGKLVGIGVEIKTRDHKAVVVEPLEGSPAAHAGVRPGDVILQINGQDVSGWSLGQISSHISGEAGQTVHLTVANPKDRQKRDLSIERAAIRLSNVTWRMLPGTDIAHLRIAMFSEGEAQDLRKALGDLRRAGARKLILDVRNNPGGALDEAVITASQFLTSGNVLWEKDATGKLTPIPVLSGGLAPDIPMAVLMNGNSASDSEIVAGALHDTKRAVLIGERTFGTGTVLSQFPLTDGSALLLAVEEWLTPNMHSFWHHGLEPDIHVSLPPGATVLEPSSEREMTADEIGGSDDVQLLRAISWLSLDHAGNHSAK